MLNDRRLLQPPRCRSLFLGPETYSRGRAMSIMSLPLLQEDSQKRERQDRQKISATLHPPDRTGSQLWTPRNRAG